MTKIYALCAMLVTGCLGNSGAPSPQLQEATVDGGDIASDADVVATDMTPTSSTDLAQMATGDMAQSPAPDMTNAPTADMATPLACIPVYGNCKFRPSDCCAYPAASIYVSNRFNGCNSSNQCIAVWHDSFGCLAGSSKTCTASNGTTTCSSCMP